MKKKQKNRLKKQAQVILFCSVLIWMAVNFLSAIPAMAFHPKAVPSIFAEYDIVATYKGYSYASEGPQGNAAVAFKQNGLEKIQCKLSSTPTGIELVQKCEVPISIARHLKVLGHKGMSHDLVVAERQR